MPAAHDWQQSAKGPTIEARLRFRSADGGGVSSSESYRSSFMEMLVIVSFTVSASHRPFSRRLLWRMLAWYGRPSLSVSCFSAKPVGQRSYE